MHSETTAPTDQLNGHVGTPGHWKPNVPFDQDVRAATFDARDDVLSMATRQRP